MESSYHALAVRHYSNLLRELGQSLTPEEVRDRFAEFKQLTHFDVV
jgi:hypothetical protein